jgi:hypothetical protein
MQWWPCTFSIVLHTPLRLLLQPRYLYKQSAEDQIARPIMRQAAAPQAATLISNRLKSVRGMLVNLLKDSLPALTEAVLSSSSSSSSSSQQQHAAAEPQSPPLLQNGKHKHAQQHHHAHHRSSAKGSSSKGGGSGGGTHQHQNGTASSSSSVSSSSSSTGAADSDDEDEQVCDKLISCKAILCSCDALLQQYRKRSEAHRY